MTSHLADLRVDHLSAPLAVPSDRPRFSWTIVSDARAVRQRSWDLVVRAAGSSEILWRSSRDSHLTSGIEWEGAPLSPASEFVWTVTSTFTDGSQARASSTFETGPSAALWEEAAWVTHERPRTQPVDHHPAPYLRVTFDVEQPVRRARLYATAGGLFQAWMNGAVVDDADFAPGWTDYHHRIPYHAYDVGALVRPGSNTVGAILGEGWYSGYYGPFGKRGFWGDVPVFRALLVLEFDDGTSQVVATDGSWEGATGEVQLAEILHGETVDRRRDVPGWSDGADVGTWSPATVAPGPRGRLVAAKMPAIRPVGEVAPVGISEPLPGTYVVDFGQNFAGRVRLAATGRAGTMIQIRHAELLESDGMLYTDNLRTARATDTVILAGSGREVFEPRFTYHGFRYAEVTGYPGGLTPQDIQGVVVSSLEGFALDFVTDNALLNQLQSNIQWTMLSNYLEVPTDCPNRDERLGWGGDAQIFAPTGMLNADLEPFYSKWLDDIADAQKPSGAFADIAPGGILDFAEEGAAGYADAGVFLPWMMYRHYGDPRVLEDFLDRGAAWLRYIGAANPDSLWREQRNSDYGDWIALEPTDKVLVATAYWAHAASVLADAAEVLGRSADEAHFRAVFDRVARAFRAEFVVNGALRETSQTAQILGIRFGLLAEEDRARAGEVLAHDVALRGHLTSGFLAVSHALPTLSATGRNDLAMAVLLRTDEPSWGAQIARGMTTIGEHWNGWAADGKPLDPWMNSFNHSPWVRSANGSTTRSAGCGSRNPGSTGSPSSRPTAARSTPPAPASAPPAGRSRASGSARVTHSSSRFRSQRIPKR